jgi:hypothetical protein
MSTNEANKTFRERSSDQKEEVKKFKSPNVKKLYGYEDKHWRILVYCKDKISRDKKLKTLKLKYPDYDFKEINL